MLTTANTRSRGGTRKVFQICLISSALSIVTTNGQAQQSQPEPRAYAADKANVPDAIAKVRSGSFVGSHVDLIVRAGAVQAIPDLKEQFVRAQDPVLKAKLAAGLVRLGDKDSSYWDFLVKFASPALESDAPDFMAYDSQGKSVPGPSPEFQGWAKSHSLAPSSELWENSVYLFPGKVVLLGWSRDPRSVPLLRRALMSPNHMIEIAAAMGLAEVGDKASVPLILEACKKAPAEAAAAIAESLVYFDDDAAQSAVDQFIPKERAKVYRDARAHGKKTPFDVPLK